MLSNFKSALLHFKSQLQTKWQISDGGPAHFHIGITIERDCSAHTIALSQTVFIDCIISQFHLDNAHPIGTPFEPGMYLSKASSPTSPEDRSAMAKTPYHELVGSLMYIAIGTHPNIVFAVNQLCRFLDCYGNAH